MTFVLYNYEKIKQYVIQHARHAYYYCCGVTQLQLLSSCDRRYRNGFNNIRGSRDYMTLHYDRVRTRENDKNNEKKPNLLYNNV